MGQYGNQPDFGTQAAVVTPDDTIAYATTLISPATPTYKQAPFKLVA